MSRGGEVAQKAQRVVDGLPGSAWYADEGLSVGSLEGQVFMAKVEWADREMVEKSCATRSQVLVMAGSRVRRRREMLRVADLILNNCWETA